MAEIDEVEIISNGGVPFYYHSNSGNPQDEVYLLQASFITALTQFAGELQKGQVKLISLERKHYLLTKSDNFTVIFTSDHEEGPNKLIEYEPKITEVKNYLDEKLLQLNIDLNNPNNPNLDDTMQQFDDYLKEKNIVISEEEYNSNNFRSEVNKLIFKSVGYEPGVCNIGRAERMKRLSFGLTFFTISLLIYAAILLFSLPEWVIFALVVPNFLGFLGIFQYFYRFCTTNAMSNQFDMN